VSSVILMAGVCVLAHVTREMGLRGSFKTVWVFLLLMLIMTEKEGRKLRLLLLSVCKKLGQCQQSEAGL
jgi:hypothetical protein